jgi:hypothetical protein
VLRLLRPCSSSAQECLPSAQVKAAAAHVHRLKRNQRKKKSSVTIVVVMGGTIYIERSGSIVVSGVTHSVPAVKGTGVVTIGESLATVYHGVVGDSISFTGTEFTVVPAGGGGPTLTSTTPTPVSCHRTSIFYVKQGGEMPIGRYFFNVKRQRDITA